MSGQTPPKGETVKPTGSPRTPRGGRLRDRVNFFENIWSQGRSASSEDLVERSDSPVQRRSSSRTSDSSFEESFERLVEEGELNGAKVVKFEKITVRRSVKEVVSSRSGLSEASRTPSEEQALDSAYQSHGYQGSKSSSVGSFTKFPSEENLGRESPQDDDKAPSEWYAEYRNQSFQHVTSKREYVRSRSEFDAHIAEIKGLSTDFLEANANYIMVEWVRIKRMLDDYFLTLLI